MKHLIVLSLLLATSSLASAGDAAAVEGPLAPIPAAAANAAALIGLGFERGPGALGIGAALLGGDEALWPQPEWDTVLPLRADWLASVRDRTPLRWPDAGSAGSSKPDQNAALVQRAQEVMAYCDGLAKAQRILPEALALRARRGLSSRDVLSEPDKLRGEIIHVEGSLRRVNAQTVPEMLRQRGVEKLYEGWVIDKRNPRSTWCIVFTELPESLQHRTNAELDVEIDFDGYFLKTLLYEARGTKSDPNRMEEAPLVLGRAPLVLAAGAAASGDPWSELIVPALTGLVVVTLGVLALLTWSFRRGDRRLFRSLERSRRVVIPERIPDSPPVRKEEAGGGALPADWMG